MVVVRRGPRHPSGAEHQLHTNPFRLVPRRLPGCHSCYNLYQYDEYVDEICIDGPTFIPACLTHCSNVGWIIFGASSDLFATWTAAFVTMTRTAFGEFDNIYPEMVDINPDAAFLIIATYQVRLLPIFQGYLFCLVCFGIFYDF